MMNIIHEITEHHREELSWGWRHMFHERTCPPVSVLLHGGVAVRRHLRSCKECRDMLKLLPTLKSAGEVLARCAKNLHSVEETTPAPGDIRTLRPQGNPWQWFDREGRYYNPPKVLILDKPNEFGLVKAAQIFEDHFLADLGDIHIRDDVYAEAWNVYSVPVGMLSKKCFRRAGLDVVDIVAEAALWEYPPIDTDSPLYYFRLLEAAVGSFFTLKAVWKAVK